MRTVAVVLFICAAVSHNADVLSSEGRDNSAAAPSIPLLCRLRWCDSRQNATAARRVTETATQTSAAARALQVPACPSGQYRPNGTAICVQSSPLPTQSAAPANSTVSAAPPIQPSSQVLKPWSNNTAGGICGVGDVACVFNVLLPMLAADPLFWVFLAALAVLILAVLWVARRLCCPTWPFCCMACRLARKCRGTASEDSDDEWDDYYDRRNRRSKRRKPKHAQAGCCGRGHSGHSDDVSRASRRSKRTGRGSGREPNARPHRSRTRPPEDVGDVVNPLSVLARARGAGLSVSSNSSTAGHRRRRDVDDLDTVPVVYVAEESREDRPMARVVGRVQSQPVPQGLQPRDEPTPEEVRQSKARRHAQTGGHRTRSDGPDRRTATASSSVVSSASTARHGHRASSVPVPTGHSPNPYDAPASHSVDRRERTTHRRDREVDDAQLHASRTGRGAARQARGHDR